MSAFIDVSCPKCGRRFGWCGEAVGRPPCPRCGHQVPREQLEADQRKMDDFRELLRERCRSGSPLLQRQRVMAGLSLRQAARLLGVAPSDLSAYESGRAELPADLAAKMSELYGVGEG